MRVLVLSLLVAIAAAACDGTPENREVFEICTASAGVPTSTTPYYVSQSDPKSSGARQLDVLAGVGGKGLLDVRTGDLLHNDFTNNTGASYTAPYSGCFYFYNTTLNANNAYSLYGSSCTKFAQFGTTPARADRAPKFFKPVPSSGPQSTYRLTLTYEVDAMYAGWAFEFLNLNVPSPAKPADSDTRCGAFYDNLRTGATVASPHGTNSINRAANGDADSANGKWTLTRSYSASGLANVSYTVQNFNDALVNCGWKRDEDNTAFTLFRATVRATGVTQGKSMRGALIRSTSETTSDLAIQFNTAVSVTSGALYVNSPLILLSEVTKQVFEPVSKTAYLMLFTSSQGPYQLEKAATNAFVCSSDSGVGCNTWTGAAPTFEPFGTTHQSLLKDTTSPVSDSGLRAQCFDAAGNVPNYASQTPTALSECRQYWFIQLNALNDCGSIFATTPETRNLNGKWTANYAIKCHSSYGGSCNIQAPVNNTVSITFETTSDNYCPQIVDTVTASAVLNVYDDFGYSNIQSQFVFGTNSYFKATVTSSIKVEALYTEEIAITLGYKNSNSDVAGLIPAGADGYEAIEATPTRQIIYTNPFNKTSDLSFINSYFAGTEPSTCDSRSKINSLLSAWDAGTSPIPSTGGNQTTRCYAPQVGGAAVLNFSVTQVSLTGLASSQTNSANNFFQFYWNEAVSGATGDFALVTQITWKGRIRYADQAQATKLIEAKFVPKYNVNPKSELAATTGATTASVTSSISGAPAASTEGSSAAISTTTIAVAAAAVAAIAVMAIAAFVVLRSRNAKMETETNLESVTLGTMGSSAQLSA